MSPRAAWLAIYLLALLGLLACDGEDRPGTRDGGPLGDDARVQALACTPDEDLIARALPCNLDLDCPCGTHCALGACLRDCAADADCAAGPCDSFGRCAGAEAGPPPIQGRLHLSRAQVEVRSPDQAVAVHLTAVNAPVGPIRTRAAAPFEIACGDEAFGPDCALDERHPDDGPLRLQIRTTLPRGLEDRGGEVTIHFSGQRLALAVLLPGVIPPEPVTRLGAWVGVARPVAAGLDAREAELALPPELAALRVPVRAWIFEETPTRLPVRFEDDFGALFPAPTSGLLEADNQGRWTGECAPQPFLPGTPLDPDAALGLRGALSDITWQGQALTLDYRALLVGLTPDRRAPYIQWRLVLQRTGDVPDDLELPAPPPPPTDLDPAWVLTPLSPEDPALLGGGPPVSQALAALCPAAEGHPAGLQAALAQGPDGGLLASGDLACAGPPSRTPLAFPIHARRLIELQTDLATCAAELQADAGDTCVHRGRALTALAAAFSRDRDRALHQPGDPSPTDPDFVASALAHRLLQQWLAVHDFLAREAGRATQLEAILGDGAPVQLGVSLREGLEASLGAWALLLHPRIATPLAVMPPEVLAEPDYRLRLYEAIAGYDPDRPIRTQVQAVGLPVNLLDSLTAQLDAFTRLVEDAQAGLSRFNAVEPLFSRLVRQQLAALALAHGLYTQARTLGPPPWEAEWILARQAYGAATARSLLALEALRAGRNPLGIEDTDLPLYRVGDQQGAGRRFLALSDYLLGQPQDARPIVPRLIERAREGLEEVRAAYVQARQRDLSAARLAQDQDRRLMDINVRYGEQIIGLCLDPDWVSFDILERWDTIDPATCYIDDRADPPCLPDASQAAAALTSAEVAREVCVAHRLRERVGEAVRSPRPEADAVIDAAGLALLPEDGFLNLQLLALTPGPGGLDDVEIHFATTADGQTQDYRLNLTDLRRLELNLPDATPAQLLPEVWRACDHRRAVAERLRPQRAPARCDLADECPVGQACLGETCRANVVPSVTGRPECYRGALGEAALAVELAQRDIQIARQELDDMVAAYDIAIGTCRILARAFSAIAELTAAHNATMAALGKARLAAQVALIALEAASAASGITNGSNFNLGAVFSALEAIPKTLIVVLEAEMAAAERAYQTARDLIEGLAEVQACFNEAGLQLVGARTAALKIQQAADEFSRQLLAFNNLKVTLSGLLLEGHLALEAERARRLSPLSGDFWIDERFDRYTRTLRLARRGLYLALLAAEYELQASLPFRADILQAQHPAVLEGVLQALQDRVITGSVAGALPAELVEVISLRSHLLRVADRSAGDPAWHRLDAGARFGRWIASPTFAVYDPQGQYLGQEIPFSIMPGGSDPRPTPEVTLLSGTDCAERLWSVNASVLGAGAATGDSSLTRLVLRKRNTFHSQRCDQPGVLQTAATRPSRNLFLDPFAYQASPEAPGPLSEDTGFTSARIQARLGVDRAALEDERFAQGASEELAGRGLYGDYALFIPAQSLAAEDRPGLQLTAIEDILLRLDSVSVARGR